MEKNELMKQYEAKVGQRVNWEANPVGYTRWLEAQLIWQSVSEKPDNEGYYLHYFTEDNYEVVWYESETWFYWNQEQDEWIEYKTIFGYWLPIPMESRNDYGRGIGINQKCLHWWLGCE